MNRGPVRLLLCHRKSDDDEDLEEMRAGVQASAEAQRPPGGYEPLVILSKHDYDQHFMRCGGWDAWARDWALSGRYAAFVVVQSRLGKAVATGLELALKSGRPVFYVSLDDQGVLQWQRVVGLKQITRSWKDGWAIRLAP